MKYSTEKNALCLNVLFIKLDGKPAYGKEGGVLSAHTDRIAN